MTLEVSTLEGPPSAPLAERDTTGGYG